MLRSISMSVSRWIAAAAVWAWRVVRIECPVIAARNAIWAVSSSRTSPTSSTSGSERRIVRSPLANVSPARGLTSTWSRPSTRYSTGSSIVVSWRSGVLRSWRQVKSVVVLPEPVGPTTTTAPNGFSTARSSASLCRRHAEGVERVGRLALRQHPQVSFSPYVVGRLPSGRPGIPHASDRDAAVLRHAAFGDVEAAHDLDRLTTAGACARGRGELAHDAVDPDAHEQPSRLRREVDVGGADVERLRDGLVDERDGRRVVVEVEDARVSSVSWASLTSSSGGTEAASLTVVMPARSCRAARRRCAPASRRRAGAHRRTSRWWGRRRRRGSSRHRGTESAARGSGERGSRVAGAPPCDRSPARWRSTNESSCCRRVRGSSAGVTNPSSGRISPRR